jgi:hypothetical protein
MDVVDISGLLYFMPIFTFLFVFVVVYSLTSKVKEHLGTNDFLNALISFLISTIFITVSSMRLYMETVIPWFAVLVVALFFILVIVAFSQQKIDAVVGKNFVLALVFILVLVFVFAGAKVFSSVLSPLFYKIQHDDRLFGGVLIFLVAALTSWLLTKK